MSIYKTSVVTAKEFNEGYSNFTVVGSPIISSDGIVSGFSADNYLEVYTLSEECYSMEVNMTFTTGSDVTNLNLPFGASGDGIGMRVRIQNSALTVQIGKGTPQLGWNSYVSSLAVATNTAYNVHFKLDSGIFYLMVNNTSNSWSYTGAIYPSSYIVGQSLQWGGLRYFLGSIDLKQFVIKVDNKVVYSPATNKGTISAYQTTANSFYEL